MTKCKCETHTPVRLTAYRVLSYQSVNQSQLSPTFTIAGWQDQLYMLQDKRMNHGEVEEGRARWRCCINIYGKTIKQHSVAFVRKIQLSHNNPMIVRFKSSDIFTVHWKAALEKYYPWLCLETCLKKKEEENTKQFRLKTSTTQPSIQSKTPNQLIHFQIKRFHYSINA